MITIQQLKELAISRRGMCLSEIYVNSHTKLLWECSEKHQWKAIPDSVKRGSWCPYCAGTAKHTIEEMCRIAEKRGGKCLSENYKNANTKLLWECHKGHQWKATPCRIKGGKWCPYCAGKYKTISDIQELAKKYDGKCLSETYLGNKVKILWECKNGHKWEALIGNIYKGVWCPHCAGNAKLTIEEMNQIAESRSGKCLSKAYINSSTKLLWECSEGHQWEAIPDSVKRGSWCPYCAGTAKFTIKDMHQIAKNKGGKCLSETYINSTTKLLWECSEGHQWEATHGKKWCPICAIKRNTEAKRLGIEYMRQIAEKRGGKCLSDVYINLYAKLLWECAEGHQWEAAPSNIKRGDWCTHCSSGLGERIIREFFEQIFRMPFPTKRPKWLINKRNNQMELDGYCESLKLAFEHQGQQHYSTNTIFITSEERLKIRQEDDKVKRELCSQQGIVLIEIPEIRFPFSEKDIKFFIKKECEFNNVPLPADFDTIEIDFKKAYISSVSKRAMDELRSIAQKQSGKCLSDVYVSNQTKLLWECTEGHQWKAVPNSIKNGAWCPYCANKRNGERQKNDIREIQKMAVKLGGRCLSENYIDIHTKLLWECAEGHQWEATANNVKRGTWCPYCAHTVTLTIEEMCQIAEKRGGKCLSETYHNAHTKLLWECSKGHRWKAAPGKIKRGTWCPYCGNTIKYTIEEMRQIAQNRGGKCLSDIYISNQTKLLWECSEGHQWEAIPTSIIRGSWCSKCYHLSRCKTRKTEVQQWLLPINIGTL